jgi:hypothetical protein
MSAELVIVEVIKGLAVALGVRAVAWLAGSVADHIKQKKKKTTVGRKPKRKAASRLSSKDSR